MTPRLVLAAGFVALAITVTPLGAARADGDDGNAKCTIATKPDNAVGKACEKGGRKEATKVMKAMVKTAKGKGVKFVCDDCHQNHEDFKLTDNAKKDYEKLLAAQ